MKGAKLLAEALVREGVKVIFGVPGLSNLAFYDALLDYVENGKIRSILVRHEQAAAHAADAYSRVSGFPGVCTATSGPGAVNLVTGVVTAYWDSSPLIAITGQVPKSSIGKMAFQEADVIGIFKDAAKFVVQLRKAEEIPLWIKNSFYIATTGRQGPVVIDVPRDVLTEDVDEVKYPEEPIVPGYRDFIDVIDPLEIKKATRLLFEAEKPLILAGAGVVWSRATDELLTLSEKLWIPMVSTLLGKSAIPHNHPLYLGVMGYYGRAEANEAFIESDVVIAVGARISDRTLPNASDLKDKKIIFINRDPTEHKKLPLPPEVAITADAKRALSSLLEAISAQISSDYKPKHETWIKRVFELREEYSKIYYREEGRGLKPWKVMKTIRKSIPPSSIITTGVGQHQMWAEVFWDVLEPGTFVTSGGMGTMGFGLPAAIGAKAAKPERVVVDLDGDGSLLMTATNLAVAVEENLPVIVVVFDNRSLGLVRQVQDLFLGKRFIAVDLGYLTDFVKLAEAFGADGYDARSYEELETALAKSLRTGNTSVIRVPIPTEELALPTLPPGGSLKRMIVSAPR
ncbi:MAG: acetolactate synthase large subunit [Acidilobaceae archaeon]